MKTGKDKKGLLVRLRDALNDTPDCDPSPAASPRILNAEKLKLPPGDTALRLVLGEAGKQLELLPDLPLDAEPGCRPSSYVICDPDVDSHLTVPIRLRPGERLTLGSTSELQQALFDYPDRVRKRHLSIRYGKNALIFKDHGSGSGICVTPHVEGEPPVCLPQRRLQQLHHLRQLLGGPVVLLSRKAALVTLGAVTRLLKDEAYRPATPQGKPGALLELPDKLVPTIVGDLHTSTDNLLNVLSRNNLLSRLESGDACLVILGDAVHSERAGEFEDMKSSMVMMDLILRLKLLFPSQIFYLRGNHDSFSESISKGGVSQGLLWLKALRKERGKAYAKLMERFYRRLPLIALSPHFIACHAAAPTSKVNREQLIAAASSSKLVLQLIGNRLRRPSRPAGYSGADVKRLRAALGAASDTPFIVGHTPMDADDTLWTDVDGIRHHHVLYSASHEWVGAFTWVGEQVVSLRYPGEPLVDRFNQQL